MWVQGDVSHLFDLLNAQKESIPPPVESRQGILFMHFFAGFVGLGPQMVQKSAEMTPGRLLGASIACRRTVSFSDPHSLSDPIAAPMASPDVCVTPFCLRSETALDFTPLHVSGQSVGEIARGWRSSLFILIFAFLCFDRFSLNFPVVIYSIRCIEWVQYQIRGHAFLLPMLGTHMAWEQEEVPLSPPHSPRPRGARSSPRSPTPSAPPATAFMWSRFDPPRIAFIPARRCFILRSCSHFFCFMIFFIVYKCFINVS